MIYFCWRFDVHYSLKCLPISNTCRKKKFQERLFQITYLKDFRCLFNYLRLILQGLFLNQTFQLYEMFSCWSKILSIFTWFKSPINLIYWNSSSWIFYNHFIKQVSYKLWGLISHFKIILFFIIFIWLSFFLFNSYWWCT